jgi:hypothetical protein
MNTLTLNADTNTARRLKMTYYTIRTNSYSTAYEISTAIAARIRQLAILVRGLKGDDCPHLRETWLRAIRGLAAAKRDLRSSLAAI